MTLLNPLALWFLLLLPLVIGLYFFREQSRPLHVPALFLWEEALGQSSSRRFFRRLRHFWLLLLAVLLLLLLTLALSRPELREFLPHRQNLVLVIDNSLSMGRTLDSRGQSTLLDQARSRAGAYVERLPRDTHAAILQTVPPRVVAGFTIDSRRLLGALDQVQLSSDRVDPESQEWRRSAELLVASRPEATEILYFTDHSPDAGRARDESAEVSPRQNLEVITLRPEQVGNAAITAFQARSGFADPAAGELYARVENFSNRNLNAALSLTVDGEMLEVISLDLPAGGAETLQTAYRFDPAAGLNIEGLARADLQLPEGFPDALPQDNQAFTVLPTPEKTRVLLVSRGNWFLESFLRADPLVDYEQLAPETFTARMGAGFDVLIFDEFLPEPALEEPAAGVLWLETAPAEWVERERKEGLARLRVAGREEGWPNLQLLDAATVRNVLPLNAQNAGQSERVRAAVETDEGETALLLGIEAGAQNGTGQAPNRWAVIGFDLRESTLPLQVGFPVMMRELLFWLSGRPAQVSRMGAQLPLGAEANLPAGGRVTQFQQDSRAGLAVAGQTGPSLGAGATFVAQQPGFYEITDASGAERWIAVSALNREESSAGFEPGTQTGDAAGAGSGREAAWPAPLQAQPPWVLLAAVALVLLVVEWFFFSRFRLQPMEPLGETGEGGDHS